MVAYMRQKSPKRKRTEVVHPEYLGDRKGPPVSPKALANLPSDLFCRSSQERPFLPRESKRRGKIAGDKSELILFEVVEKKEVYQKLDSSPCCAISADPDLELDCRVALVNHR